MKACLAGKLQEEKKIVKVQQQIKIEKNAINLQNRKRVCPGIFASALVPGQRDTGTRILFNPGQRDNRTSRPVETLIQTYPRATPSNML